MTVEEQIKEIQNAVKQGGLEAYQASAILAELSSLLGNVNEDLVTREMDYNRCLADTLKESKSVAHAKLISQTTPEYEALLRQKGTHELVQEMMRSMKNIIRVKLEEQREVRY